MNIQTAPAFMPLFRSWLETANLAKQVGSSTLSASGENLLVELDLAPMEAAFRIAEVLGVPLDEVFQWRRED